MKFSIFAVLAVPTYAIPAHQAKRDAVAVTGDFSSLTARAPCTPGEDACVAGMFAQCVDGEFVLQECAAGTICAALPTGNGESFTTCTTQADLDSRLGSNSTGTGTAGTGAGAAGDDLQSSLTLSSDLIQTGYSQDGQIPPVPAGQSASLTSSNNFINFCAVVPQLPITNGKQIANGSCNSVPQGVLAATTNMPSGKFTNPANLDTLKANTTFVITMAISHLSAGSFANAQTNYYSAPQQVDSNGDIIGHSHFVIEKLTSIKQVTPTSPGSFVFFKGVDTPALKGILSVPVINGIDVGVYRLSSINSATNHQPVLVSIAQHGALDDMVYFSVTADGTPDPAIVAALGGKT